MVVIMNKSNGSSRNYYQANDSRSSKRIIVPYSPSALYSGFHNYSNENNSLCRQQKQQQKGEASLSLSTSAVITQALAVVEHHQSCSKIEIQTDSSNTVHPTDSNSSLFFGDGFPPEESS
jgi:hypothetical protein